MIPSYQYKATVISIHDGDTVQLDVDLGFRVHFALHCRLFGINAPELSTTAGKKSRTHLAFLLGQRDATPPLSIYLQTIKDSTEKYGRLLGILSRYDSTVNPGMPTVNQLMVSDGFAVEWDGKGPRPV